MTIKACEEIQRFLSCHELYSIIFFHSNERSTMPFKTKYLITKHKQKTSSLDFFPSPLIFKLQQEVSKFNDICNSWSSRKTELKTNILNLGNRNFENISFFRRNYLNKYLKFIYFLEYLFLLLILEISIMRKNVYFQNR